MNKTTKKEIKKARKLKLPPRDYQPSRKELRKEYDMPGADIDTVSNAFFRPFVVEDGGDD